MARTRWTVCAAAVLWCLTGAVPAWGQEAGAGRLEIGVATGGGALFVTADEGVSRFGQYSVGATVTFNVRDSVGVEGDFGMAVGRRQDLTLNGVRLLNQKTPKILNYNATLVFSPMGTHHRAFPYLAGGLGGLTMLHAPDTETLGLTTSRTFLTVNTGGGLNYFPIAHLGVRADYRFMIIRNGADAPVILGQGAARFAHRLYGAVILTY